ncbi:MAG: hypothetical protein UU71_C0004G0020 [Parcubacteria group bacterium GW2011_GWB1_41_6]|nr:MAG: hypothetical protein UU71_C0004G0020 [Parcubacteria group bacterium GW2011_GWB1_41_6]KKS33941.1 MAG: hypothetical protein UU96_C0011G0019 [Parcubacteria group bacterium GW2011_GWC2_42_13]
MKKIGNVWKERIGLACLLVGVVIFFGLAGKGDFSSATGASYDILGRGNVILTLLGISLTFAGMKILPK